MAAGDFLQACRLIPKKGVATSLCAFAIFQKEFPKRRAVIAGKGPLQAHLEELAEELGIVRQGSFPRVSLAGGTDGVVRAARTCSPPERDAAGPKPGRHSQFHSRSDVDRPGGSRDAAWRNSGGRRAWPRRIAGGGARLRSSGRSDERDRPLAHCFSRDGSCLASESCRGQFRAARADPSAGTLTTTKRSPWPAAQVARSGAGAAADARSALPSRSRRIGALTMCFSPRRKFSGKFLVIAAKHAFICATQAPLVLSAWPVAASRTLRETSGCCLRQPYMPRRFLLILTLLIAFSVRCCACSCAGGGASCSAAEAGPRGRGTSSVFRSSRHRFSTSGNLSVTNSMAGDLVRRRRNHSVWRNWRREKSSRSRPVCRIFGSGWWRVSTIFSRA